MAISLRLPAVPTDDEILQLSEQNPGFQFERTAAGELVVTPNGIEGAGREAELLGQLYIWAASDGTGKVFGASAGFHLADGSLFAPDASWVTWVRLQSIGRAERKKFGRFCPDAVFEIASESDTLASLHRKMQAYVANGARLAVLIDPEHRAVEIYAPGREVKTVKHPSVVSFDPVLPGFMLDLAPIFE